MRVSVICTCFNKGAWIAQASDQTARTVLFALRYNKGYWKKIKLLS